ncbi:hypothetical protein BJV82DRAFT_601144 [Fennellomyces sp. T-0311]|nr:hypothetical protein BJV82DRAFT_601144 [Fennellomyces sp. T-0311]
MYEFQPPRNLNAIKSTIARRIKEQRAKHKEEEKLKTRLAIAPPDSGLPSPPVEACHYEPFKGPEEQPNNELAVNALLELSGGAGTPSSSASEDTLDIKAIQQKIQDLQQEKHELFQIMKNLLTKPPPPSPEAQPKEQEVPQQPSKSRERLRSCSNGRARTPPPPSCTPSRVPSSSRLPDHHRLPPPPRYTPYRRISPPPSSRYYGRGYSRMYNTPPLSAPPFPSPPSSMPYAVMFLCLRPSHPKADRLFLL